MFRCSDSCHMIWTSHHGININVFLFFNVHIIFIHLPFFFQIGQPTELRGRISQGFTEELVVRPNQKSKGAEFDTKAATKSQAFGYCKKKEYSKTPKIWRYQIDQIGYITKIMMEPFLKRLICLTDWWWCWLDWCKDDQNSHNMCQTSTVLSLRLSTNRQVQKNLWWWVNGALEGMESAVPKSWSSWELGAYQKQCIVWVYLPTQKMVISMILLKSM